MSPRVRTYERNQTIPWLSTPNLRSTSNLARALLPPTPRPPICIEPSKSLKSCIPNVLHKNQLTRGLARGLARFWKSRQPTFRKKYKNFVDKNLFVSLYFFDFQRIHQWEHVLFEIALRARSALLCRSELAARVRFDIALPLD